MLQFVTTQVLPAVGRCENVDVVDREKRVAEPAQADVPRRLRDQCHLAVAGICHQGTQVYA